MAGPKNVTILKELSARIRKRQDRDIKRGLQRLGYLDQGELSDLVRNGFRMVLKKKGVL